MRIKDILSTIIIIPIIYCIAITELTRINPQFDLLFDTALAKIFLWCLT